MAWQICIRIQTRQIWNTKSESNKKADFSWLRDNGITGEAHSIHQYDKCSEVVPGKKVWTVSEQLQQDSQPFPAQTMHQHSAQCQNNISDNVMHHRLLPLQFLSYFTAIQQLSQTTKNILASSNSQVVSRGSGSHKICGITPKGSTNGARSLNKKDCK